MCLYSKYYTRIFGAVTKGSQKLQPVAEISTQIWWVEHFSLCSLSLVTMAGAEELAVIFQTFSNQITGLTNQLSNATNSIGSISSSLIVPSYSGDPKEFQNWIKTIEKQALLDNLADEGIKRLTFRSSREAVSDFIQRFLHDYPQENWARLKQKLTARFCDVHCPNACIYPSKKCTAKSRGKRPNLCREVTYFRQT